MSVNAFFFRLSIRFALSSINNTKRYFNEFNGMHFGIIIHMKNWVHHINDLLIMIRVEVFIPNHCSCFRQMNWKWKKKQNTHTHIYYAILKRVHRTLFINSNICNAMNHFPVSVPKIYVHHFHWIRYKLFIYWNLHTIVHKCYGVWMYNKRKTPLLIIYAARTTISTT